MKFEEARKMHDSVEVPEILEDRVEEAISDAMNQAKGKRIKWWGTRGGLVAASLLFAFVITVNTNTILAETLKDLPGIGAIARLMTFVTFEVSNETYVESVVIPEVEIETKVGQDNQEHENQVQDSIILQEKINEAIRSKLETVMMEGEKRAKEYKEAYIETGGKEENYVPVEIVADYELKYQDDRYLSFMIYSYETVAPAYRMNEFYTINLLEMKEVTLSDMFGDDYVAYCNEKVRHAIAERSKLEDQSFFEGDMGFVSIHEDQPFFINEKGDVVLFFEKYEIAPGYMGTIEIEIEKPK